MTTTKGTRVEILHVQSPGYWKAGQYGYIVGHSDRGGMWLQDRSGESHPGESVYLVAKTKDGRSGSLWFSSAGIRRTGTKKATNKAGTKRAAKRSINRAGSVNSRKISAAARAHVDDLVYSQGWSPADVASDPRPLESWEGPQILESAGLTRSATDEQYAAARRALAAAIRAYAGKLSRSKTNRAGTKRRATKKTANKAGKRRNRAGTPKRSARTGRFLKG